jgi:hypothetical protein
VDVGGAGDIVIKDGGGTVIASASFGATAFGAAAAGVATANGLPIAGAGLPAAGAGTTGVTFEVRNGSDTVIYSGNVGAVGSGASMELNNVSIANGQVVNITSCTYTQPA